MVRRLGRYLTRSRLSRYVVVGGVIAVLYFGTVIALIELLGFSPPVSIAGAYIVTAVARFVLHRFWVFDDTTGKFHWQAGKYLVTIAWTYGLNVLFTELLIRITFMPARYAVIIATAMVTSLAYIVSSRWIFK